MIKRRVRRARSHPLGEPREGETYSYETKVGARHLRHGDGVRVKGRRGVFTFIRLEERPGRPGVVALWDSGGAWRFVRPEALHKVSKKKVARG